MPNIRHGRNCQVPQGKTTPQKYKTQIDFLFPLFPKSYFEYFAKIPKDDLSSLRGMDIHSQWQGFRLSGEGKRTDHMDVTECPRLAPLPFVTENEDLTKLMFIF